jgi:hypothetical protein
MLERLMWEAKMCALTSAMQRCVSTAAAIEGLSPESLLQGMLCAAVTYARTTSGLSDADIERSYHEALRAVPAREMAPSTGVVLV